MIHAQKSSGGRIRRDTLIIVPQDSRYGAFLSDRSVKQAKHYLFYLANIWAMRLDIADVNILRLI